jgi:hypothetical protein
VQVENINNGKRFYFQRDSKVYAHGECKFDFCKAPTTVYEIQDLRKDGKSYAEMMALPCRERLALQDQITEALLYEYVVKNGLDCNLRKYQDGLNNAAEEKRIKTPKSCYICPKFTRYFDKGDIAVIHIDGNDSLNMSKCTGFSNFATCPTEYRFEWKPHGASFHLYACQFRRATNEEAAKYNSIGV